MLYQTPIRDETRVVTQNALTIESEVEFYDHYFSCILQALVI